MAEILPVAFYPEKPTGSLLSAVKAAKADVKTETLMKPVRAVPGSSARVIAIQDTPSFICEHYVVPPGDTEKLKYALEWALYLRDAEGTDNAVSVLREVFGPDVQELTNE